MKCPHCLVEFHPTVSFTTITYEDESGPDAGVWIVESYLCPNPECQKAILYVVLDERPNYDSFNQVRSLGQVKQRVLVYPRGTPRPLPPEVPREYAEDYKEACLVLPDSPKASAALSRRCLQNLLRSVAKVTPGKLANEIQEVVDSKTLPSHLAESIDAIRNVGNFAAHPVKSERSGEIIDVELGEAEWTLAVLELLFDFYLVQPAVTQRKRDDLNRKLADAGQRPMK